MISKHFDKINYILLFLILIGFSCKQEDLTKTNTFMDKSTLGDEPPLSDIFIDKNKLGHLKIGTDISELRLKFPSKVKDIVMLSEEEEPAVKYTFNNNKSVVIEITENKKSIWAIRIEDSFFKTKKRVGVGSTFEEILKVYPDHKVTFGQEEGRYLSIWVPEIAGYFSFPVKELSDEWIESRNPDMSKVAKFRANIVIVGRAISHE